MKNKVKISIELENFEPIAETSKNRLTGGFSSSKSVSGPIGLESSLPNINCLGANCTLNCGDGQVINT